MRFNQDTDFTSYSVRSYHHGKVSVNVPIKDHLSDGPEIQQEVLTDSFIMTPRELIKSWPPTSLNNLTLNHLKIVSRLKPELVVLGTGQNIDFPEARLIAELARDGIGMEVMDNSAACRTYNILMHEGRNVAMALIM